MSTATLARDPAPAAPAAEPRYTAAVIRARRERVALLNRPDDDDWPGIHVEWAAADIHAFDEPEAADAYRVAVTIPDAPFYFTIRGETAEALKAELSAGLHALADELDGFARRLRIQAGPRP
jgi:hypothetical protein